MSGNIQYSKICLVLLGIVCAGALFARIEGIKWPKLHPDEPVIGTWIEQSVPSVYIKDRVYPNGFFVLARPFVWINQMLVRINQSFDYESGKIDRVRGVKADGIYLGRWLNALAGMLLCIPVFLFVSRITRSSWAGLFSACLVGFAQYAVEHSHYAETDIAALLTLTFALWLWVMAGDTVSRRWFAAAAIASGFAAGTKFTLTMLGPIVLIEAVLLARRRFPRGWWRWAVGLSCLGLLLFGVGFVVANPAVLLHFNWFWAGLAAEKQRVFAETALNLGPLGGQPNVKWLHHFWFLHACLKTMGDPWVVLIAAGLSCAVLGFARRYWTVLLLFPLIYAVYWLFMAPWVRSQEFLLFLPSFAALAALPLVVFWRVKNYFVRAFVFIIAVWAIAANGSNGLRGSALFGWKDTRFLAWEWLQIRLPLESKTAAESYAEAACINTWKSPLSIKKIEGYGIAPLIDQGADYLLRTSNINGRGLRNPLTGELYPEPAEIFRQFLAGSELLCSWAPLPPQGFATFISPAIELYGLRRFTPTGSLQAGLPQPALIINSDQNPVGRQTFFPIGHRLSCAICLLIDRLPQTIAVGGPESLDKPVFLVLNTVERSAVINIRGFGMEEKVALDPYDTAVVPLKRPEWRPRVQSFETITLKTEPVEDVLYIPCFARIAFTTDEAVRVFLETAREDRIKKYFSEELLEKELSPGVKYIMATGLGLWPMADRAEQSAFAVQTDVGKCIQTDPASVSINGCSGYYYEQFARARLQQPYDFACLFPLDKYDRKPLQDAMKVLDLQLPQDSAGGEKTGRSGFADYSPARAPGRSAPAKPGSARAERGASKDPGYYQRLTIPVLLGRGRYELHGELMLKLEGAETDLCVPLAVRTIKGETDADSCLELQPGTWRSFSLVFKPRSEIQPQLDFQSPAAAQLYLKNMEICWSLSNTLESVRADLAVAVIRHSIHRADWEKAAAQLTALPEANEAANELEIRQMMFVCADGMKDDLRKRQAARRLLELAPGHYLSLLALAADDEAARRAAHQMEGNLKYPPLFTPWLALAGFSFNSETREARCVFEALRSETPGLAVSFWLQRRGEWRRKQVQSLTAGARMSKGERVVIVVRLNNAFGQTPDLNKLALGVETDVVWHAGAIPLATGGYVVPFSRLSE